MGQEYNKIIIALFATVVYLYLAPIKFYVELWANLGAIAITIAIPLAVAWAFAIPFIKAFYHYQDRERDWQERQVELVIKREKVRGSKSPILESNPPTLLADNDPQIEINNDWLNTFCLPSHNPHIAVFGGTGDGKTTLIQLMVWLLQKPHKSAGYHIYDPHNEADKWFTKVVSDDLGYAENFAHYAVDVLQKRKEQKPDYIDILIASEIGEYSNTKFSKIIEPVATAGRKYGEVLIMDNQGFTKSSCGFDPQQLSNFGKIFMGDCAFDAMSHAIFSQRSNKQHKKIWQEQLTKLASQNRGKAVSDPDRTRYGLAVPTVGMPFVFELDSIDVEALEFEQKADINQLFLLPPKEQTDLEVLTANSDKIKRKKGVITQASVGDILGIPNAGSYRGRILNVIKEYEQ